MQATNTNRNALPSAQKDIQTFLIIVNYLSKFSPTTAEVCETLQHVASVKAEWTWNLTYLELFTKAKAIIKKQMHAWSFTVESLYS